MGVVARLRSAYSDGGVPACCAVYQASIEKYPAYRVLARLLNGVCPMSEILAWTVRLDERIARDGPHPAAATVFRDLAVPLETAIPAGAETVLRTAPVLLYGNHPSIVTPLTITAAIDRGDLRMLVAEFFTKLLPASAPHVFPLWVPHRRTFHDVAQSGIAHTVALAFLFHMDSLPPPSVRREHNLTMLRQAADHIRSGGSGLIFPGGSAPKGRRWFPGIGVLARSLAATGDGRLTHLAPFRVENDNNARCYSLLASGRRAEAERALRIQEPVTVRFARPIPLEDLITDPTLPPAAIAELLKRHYDGLFSRER